MRNLWPRLHLARKLSQVFFFALFSFLLLAPASPTQVSPATNLFFRLNPLSALSASLATRGWVGGLEWALLTILVTILLGRAWCGWICPLGSLLDWISFGKRPASAKPRSTSWQKVKLYGLMAIGLMAAFGSLSLLAFDPIAILTRTTATVLLPAGYKLVDGLITGMYQVPFLETPADFLESALRGRVLPVQAPVYLHSLLPAVIFGVILGLNLVARRFWCRFLCPLGALLGLFTRLPGFRLVASSKCSGCSLCARACPVEAISLPENEARVAASECTLCLDCTVSCNRDGWEYRAVPLKRKIDPAQGPGLTRREALAALALGGVSLALLRPEARLRRKLPFLIRPPGASNEDAFLSACLRCAQCIEICPTSGLQPALDQAGLAGLWTPVLAPRLGYCDYSCNACGQVCPSGAIPNLPLAEKRQAVIGKASVDKDRCLPWASGVPCIVCEEMCPTPQKSIALEEAKAIGPTGEMVTVQRPVVLREVCTGCGICENHCPLEGEAGIRVYTLHG